MKSIKFNDFNIIEGKIECTSETFEDNILIKSDKLYFELSEKIIVNNNLIAIALSTLCGPVFDEVYMDLEVGEETFNHLKNFTQSEFSVKEINQSAVNSNLINDKILLNFSGGFDSLALYCILPSSTELISLDFKGNFAREENFFKKFSPFTVQTNIVELGYNRNSWSFMGIGSILFSEYLNAGYEVFGSILEAGSYSFTKRMSLQKNTISSPMHFTGLKDIRFAHGLTEVGTAIILLRCMPYLINESLISLANPGELKRYRKQLLVEIASKRINKKIDLTLVEHGIIVPFGSYLADDFLSLYIIKHAGIKEAEKILTDIPEEGIELASELSLEFYEKYNTNFLNSIPIEFRADFISNLCKIGIYPYNQKDWEEFNKVISFLRKYHNDLDYLLNLD